MAQFIAMGGGMSRTRFANKTHHRPVRAAEVEVTYGE